jgi:hypothetical protein
VLYLIIIRCHVRGAHQAFVPRGIAHGPALGSLPLVPIRVHDQPVLSTLLARPLRDDALHRPLLWLGEHDDG